MTLFGGCFRARRVLVTGHTGFKGSWLALWLHALGAEVTGVALSPDGTPNHWDLLGLSINEYRLDIRDAPGLTRVVVDTQPEVVFHMAAQPLVRRSYRDPLETWSTNVMGTVHLFEACRQAASVRAVVVVTSDKCYMNREWPWGYRETDRLGGRDPYSASKAATEIVADSYRASYFGGDGASLIATARAGNVIGGGDWSEDRLVPDLVRGFQAGEPTAIRNPNSTRPWQYVLDPLCGYLRLAQLLLSGRRAYAEAWNFGPAPEGNRTVQEAVERLQCHWPALSWRNAPGVHPHEASLLYIDASKARELLGWKSIYSFEDGLRSTAHWYRAFLESGVVSSRQQLEEFVSAAAASGASWYEP